MNREEGDGAPGVEEGFQTWETRSFTPFLPYAEIISN